MSTATDLGTTGVLLVGLQGSGANEGAADQSATPPGLRPFSVNQPVEGDVGGLGPIYSMSAFDTVALATITWLSYGDPQEVLPPTANPVINISATRIR